MEKFISLVLKSVSERGSGGVWACLFSWLCVQVLLKVKLRGGLIWKAVIFGIKKLQSGTFIVAELKENPLFEQLRGTQEVQMECVGKVSRTLWTHHEQVSLSQEIILVKNLLWWREQPHMWLRNDSEMCAEAREDTYLSDYFFLNKMGEVQHLDFFKCEAVSYSGTTLRGNIPKEQSFWTKDGVKFFLCWCFSCYRLEAQTMKECC